MVSINQLQQLMEQYTEGLLRLAFYYVKDSQMAEDLVQDVFIKLYTNSNEQTEIKDMKSYLYKMTANKCKDYLKSWSYRKIQFQQRFINEPKTNHNDNLLKKDEQTIIGDAILQLPLKQREVLIYYYFNEMPVLEIAQFLGVSDNTVKSRLRLGRKQLKEQLDHIEWEVLLNG